MTEIAEVGPLERLQVQADKREAGVQRYVRRQFGEGLNLPEERALATVKDVRLDDLQALLALVRQPDPRVSAAALDVIAERARQIEREGWSPEHDDKHSSGELAYAAATYAGLAGKLCAGGTIVWGHIMALWPFREKPKYPDGDKRRCLVKAGALILAEIERLDRATFKGVPTHGVG